MPKFKLWRRLLCKVECKDLLDTVSLQNEYNKIAVEKNSHIMAPFQILFFAVLHSQSVL